MTQNQQIAKSVIEIESKSIANLADRLDDNFDKVIEMILSSEGRVVISGIGKSGHIGRKISATLASTGTTSFFLHPAEALHGDLGMLRKGDILIAISNSGNNEELARMIPVLERIGVKLIAMTGNCDSVIAKEAKYCLDISVDKEGCPLELAPMASAITALAMGDAIAAALMRQKGFKEEDFALYHPGGDLGKKLLTKVKNIMRVKRLPKVKEDDSFVKVIEVMTKGRMGMCLVQKADGGYGLITDGALRRALGRTDDVRFGLLAKDMMSPNPKTISQDASIAEAERVMVDGKIKELLAVDETGVFAGVVQLYDIGSVS